MRTLLILPLLLMFLSAGQAQSASSSGDGSSVTVLSFKWSKSRQAVGQADGGSTVAPAAALLSTDKNYERNARENATKGAVRDIKAETADGRSAVLEKNERDARSAPNKPVDGFAFRAKVQNNSSKVIEVLFWEYQFREASNPANLVRRQFLCGVNIKPDKEKELQAFSASGPSDVVSVDSLANKSGNLFLEKVLINRVEYSDGTIWQRKDWNFAEVKASVARAVSTPWGTEMCRGL